MSTIALNVLLGTLGTENSSPLNEGMTSEDVIFIKVKYRSALYPNCTVWRLGIFITTVPYISPFSYSETS